MPASLTGLLQSLQDPTAHTHTHTHTAGLYHNTFKEGKRMVSTRSLDKAMVFLCVCILFNSIRTDSRPLSRRSVSEVQLMHSIGVRKHIQQRQDWLQEHMQDIHTAPMHGGKISSARITTEHSPSKGVMPNTPKRDVVETLEMQ
ncbi:hypothetical protein AMELA_G00011370 [Ameiurus melas]|uniref:Parathyroid hormone n=1 Tax=Ameiurus melas TaxID=219545 RepID=A0A7J6BGN6_AMEME|nr:hypothetical protein AMELA_G00011370 [Ameiurus melas]